MFHNTIRTFEKQVVTLALNLNNWRSFDLFHRTTSTIWYHANIPMYMYPGGKLDLSCTLRTIHYGYQIVHCYPHTCKQMSSKINLFGQCDNAWLSWQPTRVVHKVLRHSLFCQKDRTSVETTYMITNYYIYVMGNALA